MKFFNVMQNVILNILFIYKVTNRKRKLEILTMIVKKISADSKPNFHYFNCATCKYKIVWSNLIYVFFILISKIIPEHKIFTLHMLSHVFHLHVRLNCNVYMWRIHLGFQGDECLHSSKYTFSLIVYATYLHHKTKK